MRYTNPIIEADFSDPDVIEKDGEYFMVTSSFNYLPGIPVYRSKNMVNWELIGHVLKEFPKVEAAIGEGEGVWAPAIRYHAGKFYCTFPIYGDGIWTSEAEMAQGEWSKPVRLLKGEGLEDPCPIWLGERTYLAVAYAKSKAGFNSRIDICEVTRDLKERLSPLYAVYNGEAEAPVIEGPKFYTKDNYIYILAPAGGAKEGWQTALRAKDIYGPYEHMRIMEGNTDKFRGAHQGALIPGKGKDWFLHFAYFGVYGRALCLEPVTWKDGWPYLGEQKGGMFYPVNEGDTEFAKTEDRLLYTDEFLSGLGKMWQIAGKRDEKSSDECACSTNRMWNVFGKSGVSYKISLGLCLAAKREHSKGNMISVPFPAFNFTLECNTDVGAIEGAALLCVEGEESWYLAVQKENRRMAAEVLCSKKEMYHKELTREVNCLSLKVSQNEDRLSCTCTFFVNGEKAFSFSPKEKRWTGCRIGLGATGEGFARFEYFRVYGEDGRAL